MITKKIYTMTSRSHFKTEKCGFEYYSKEKGKMAPCGKKALFTYNRPRRGLCLECAKIMNSYGYGVMAPDGMVYDTVQAVIDKFGLGGKDETN